MAKKKGPKGDAPASGGPSTSSRADPTPEHSSAPVRGRGGFKDQELSTIPQGVTVVSTGGQGPGHSIEVLSNFITVKPMKPKPIYSYRVDFEPEIESSELKRRQFTRGTRELLSKDAIFDGSFEARSSVKTREPISHLKVPHPKDSNTMHTITLKLVGNVSPGTSEMLRVYNTHMKEFLRELHFRRLAPRDGYVDAAMAVDLPNTTLTSMRGFRTAINVHERDQVLMNLEPAQKIVHKQSVNELMVDIVKRAGPSWQSSILAELTGKQVITNYDQRVYRIESVNYKLSPASKFTQKATGKEISYAEYFKQKYSKVVRDTKQPLLLVVPSNKRRDQEPAEKDAVDIYVVPELCNLAGLTESQRSDGRLRTPMIQVSQVEPSVRVQHITDFLKRLKNNKNVSAKLDAWSYSFDAHPTKMRARVMPIEKVGDGKTWIDADHTGSFERTVMQRSLGRIPVVNSLVILVPANLQRDSRGPPSNRTVKQEILELLKGGFDKVKIKLAGAPTIIDVSNDRADTILREMKKLPRDTTIAIIVMQRQQKSTYDAIKKEASVERGLITQVVTAKLLLDQRKASGAAVKIAIQVAAKIGGEPWLVQVPTKGDMICGYDTYHDTADRGRSFGAFLASMNDTHSRWFSRADEHDKKSEISPHMPTNVADAMKQYQKLNGTWPKRVIIYRDGVGDGQVAEVLKIEVQQVVKAMKQVNANVLLTFVVVNKRIGARFYHITAPAKYSNPPPGSVIDTVCTRATRFDFYLVSQHTRLGSVTPTYYNVIYDQAKISPADHQALAYKLCYMYYNWAGTVRVPAPCQYAHKLALLCGEHLHRAPNANLCDRLHFL